ncbi:MAG: MOSC N-terminal beta barrel domain-containing protein [Burkholderiales bacterium]|nr:MOSC N-terminal beta barrel domain-containing protein [Burkholderiales bacterium]
MADDIRVASLHVYPVKGCRGLSPASARLAITGLSTDGVGDREFMIVDRDGRFVTQRDFPRLALIDAVVVDGALVLSAPGCAPLSTPLAGKAANSRNVVVWSSEVRGFDAGDAAASWLSVWLASELRLVRFDRKTKRLCNPEYAGDSGAHTLFADSYPLLVIGEESLAELNERLAAAGHRALPMNRFRPCIVLSGLPPFAEDQVDTITIGDAVLKCVKPCVRCRVTTTDQATAEVGIEPLRTLGEFRMDARMGGVTFGMNAIVLAGDGSTLRAGAAATVDYRF